MNRTARSFDRTTAAVLVRLCDCVLAGTSLSAELLADTDLQALYDLAAAHSLTALVCEGLESASYLPSQENIAVWSAFQGQRAKAKRKNLLLDSERAKLSAFMEEQGIWYMPLKGVILKDLYPKLGLRQMADNDILFDECARQTVGEWFSTQGYTTIAYGQGNHDVYCKAPVYNFEMHCALYDTERYPKLSSYYATVKARLIRERERSCCYRFTPEDFYIYFISHGFKHFDQGGTGFRFLTDLYVYLSHYRDHMDPAYIRAQLQLLGILAFEEDCRALTDDIFARSAPFSFSALSSARQTLLVRFLSHGAYGTRTNYTVNTVGKIGRSRYLFHRLFPDLTNMAFNYPVLGRHKWLLPSCWLVRWIKGICTTPGRILRELAVILRSSKK